MARHIMDIIPGWFHVYRTEMFVLFLYIVILFWKKICISHTAFRLWKSKICNIFLSESKYSWKPLFIGNFNMYNIIFVTFNSLLSLPKLKFLSIHVFHQLFLDKTSLIQSNLSIATIDGSSENRSHKTGGCWIEVVIFLLKSREEKPSSGI